MISAAQQRGLPTVFRRIALASEAVVHSYPLKDDGLIPNNPALELLLYRAAIVISGEDSLREIRTLLARNGWDGVWRGGVYTFHHYHSTAHEFLLVDAGWARVQLGGERGITERVESGDAIIIPAGVGHKNLEQSPDFSIIGAYPRGQHWDLCYGKKAERPAADKHITLVPLPLKDPIYGVSGPLLQLWRPS